LTPYERTELYLEIVDFFSTCRIESIQKAIVIADEVSKDLVNHTMEELELFSKSFFGRELKVWYMENGDEMEDQLDVSFSTLQYSPKES
jgi:hypothetical protein